MKLFKNKLFWLGAMSIFLVSCGGAKRWQQHYLKPNQPASPMPETSTVASPTDSDQKYIRGSLSKDVIRKTVHKSVPAINDCYTAELEKNPTAQGKVAFKFIIDSDGTVRSASEAKTEIESQEMNECILRVLAEMVFPAPKGGGIVIVTYPFEFSTPEQNGHANKQLQPTAEGGG